MSDTQPDTHTSILFEIRLHAVDSDTESRQAYNALYASTDISQTHSFYLWIMDLLALRPGERYLDVSCGRAQLCQLALEQGATPHGLDLSHTALGTVDNAHGRLGLVTGNSQQLPYRANSFDVLSNIGSLEHYVDMDAAVREMVRVLKPNGRAIVLVPNSFSLLHNILVAYKEGRTHVDHQPIQRYAARREWQALLKRNGFIVDKTLRYEIERPRVRADWARYLRHPKKLIRLLLTPFVPFNLSFCFVYVCRKPE